MIDYKEILKEGNMDGRDFARKLGLSYSSYRSLVARGTPKWIKAFELGYKIGKGLL